MRYMQIIEAPDVHAAQRAYAALMQRHGIPLDSAMTIHVETVHRAGMQHGSWLCYIAQVAAAA